MSANQIIIPLSFLIFGLFVAWLIIRARKHTRENLQTKHRPNAPSSNLNKEAIAQSARAGVINDLQDHHSTARGPSPFISGDISTNSNLE